MLRPDGADCHSQLGYMIIGGQAGPCLLVTSSIGRATTLVEMLRRILRTEELRGCLALTQHDLFACQNAQGAWLRNQISPVDTILALPALMSAGSDLQLLRAVLAKAATLGMTAPDSARLPGAVITMEQTTSRRSCIR
ncbi:MAG: hypothetical protein EA339_01300 [Rhodobacteraceae bacterium]|nr:MAG: hypothetical protein EA339_01300 [Paracoccaceae bacterium]